MKKISLLVIVVMQSMQLLCAQTKLIPYRQGNLWGVSDTSLNLVVQPKYDEIIKHRNGWFANPFIEVRKDSLYGVITKDSVVIKPSLRKVGFENEFIVDVVSEIKGTQYAYYTTYPIVQQHKVYYNLKGQRLWDDTLIYTKPVYEHFDSENNWSLFSLKKVNGKFNLVAYNVENQTYKMVFEDVDVLECEVDYDKKRVYVKTVPGGSAMLAVNVIFDVNGTNAKPPTPQPVNGFYELIWRDSKQVYVKRPMYRGKVDKYFPFQSMFPDQFYGCGSSHYMNEHFGASIRYDFKLSEDRAYLIRTFTHAHSGYLLEQSNWVERDTVSAYELRGRNMETIRYAGMGRISNPAYNVNGNLYQRVHTYLADQYVVYSNGGKQGALTEQGAIPAGYDGIQGVIVGNESYFVVGVSKDSAEMKFGVLNLSGQTVVPTNQDSIGFITNSSRQIVGLKVYRSGMVGIYQKPDGKVNNRFDVIEMLDEKGEVFAIELNGKHGYIHPKAMIPPTFNYHVIGHEYYNGYLVWQLGDANGEFLGYGDRRGVLYFEP